MHFRENEYPLEDLRICLLEETIERSEDIIEAPPGKVLLNLRLEGS